MKKSIIEVFAQNRAEEFPDDLWNRFVLPIDFNSVALKEKKKATVIVGGRGSGKTMFIKYHCHATSFSHKRPTIDENELKFIGIYWRPDTTFVQNIKKEWVGNNWESVFNTFITINLLIEFCKLSRNIISSNYDYNDINSNLAEILVPTPIQKVLGLPPTKLIDAEEYFQDALFTISNWINFPDFSPQPYNLDLKSTLMLLISKFQRSNVQFSDTIFHVFIDEFENLTPQQQVIINTWLKHGQNPLIFSIAYKKHAQVENQTKSKEKLEERDDFRYVDVESLYYNSEKPRNFEILASEVLILYLFEFLEDPNLEKLITAFSDVEKISIRKEDAYQKEVKAIISQVLPGISLSKASEQVLEDKPLLAKLKKNLISEGLKLHENHDYTADDFIDFNFPEASLVNGVLLNRESQTPEKIKREFDTLISTGDSSKYKAWIQNNLLGVILYIYNTLSTRVSPTYAGFSGFILMSKGNLRHFLELCFQSFSKAENHQELLEGDFVAPISIDTQAKATKVTSYNQLNKIVNLGSNGKHLKRIANRLGIIFSLSQKRKSQSEPEVNHFTIKTTDVSLLSEQTQLLLNESLVWSVLSVEKSTKNKSTNDIELVDYIFHPVLSCYFGISPRKKRKIPFSKENLEIIFIGDDKQFNSLLKEIKVKWKIIDSTENDIEEFDNEEANLSGEQFILGLHD
jgi:hypothetical protein